MGRPESKNPKTETIPVRVTMEEKKRIAERAKAMKVTMSEYLRVKALNDDKPFVENNDDGDGWFIG